MKRIVSAHQPHYLPWIGYIHKILLSDIFVIMDNMEYTQYSYINRNRILDRNGIFLLTVPILYKGKSHKLIKEIEIDNRNNSKWAFKHLTSMKHNYGKSTGFYDFFEKIESVYRKKNERLIDLDIKLLKIILKYLEIDTRIILASDYDIGGKKEVDLFWSLVEKTGSSVVLLGMGASTKYIDTEKVKERCSIAIQIFDHPHYKQRAMSFKPGISIVDMLFNVKRPDAIKMIQEAGTYRIL